MRRSFLILIVGFLILMACGGVPEITPPPLPEEPIPAPPSEPMPPVPIPSPPEIDKYVGSVNSDIYHYPNCRWAKKIKPENEIWFDSAKDAKIHGYRPCKVCKPPN